MVKKNKSLRFLKHAIKQDGKRIKVWYSQGELVGYPKGTITIYARDYGNQLPLKLKPINKSDMMTDYFETDRARIVPKSKHYKEILKVLKKEVKK